MPVGAEREAGLVGMLVALVILGVMAALVVSSLDGFGRGGVGPAGLTGPEASLLDQLAPVNPGGPEAVAADKEVSCRADLRILATVIEAYRAERGAYPASIEELVANGKLVSPPPLPGFTFTLEVVGGRPTGRVLVNGKPGATGCDAP